MKKNKIKNEFEVKIINRHPIKKFYNNSHRFKKFFLKIISSIIKSI